MAGEGGVGAVLGLVECEDLEARTDEGGWSYGGNKWEVCCFSVSFRIVCGLFSLADLLYGGGGDGFRA